MVDQQPHIRITFLDGSVHNVPVPEGGVVAAVAIHDIGGIFTITHCALRPGSVIDDCAAPGLALTGNLLTGATITECDLQAVRIETSKLGGMFTSVAQPDHSTATVNIAEAIAAAVVKMRST